MNENLKSELNKAKDHIQFLKGEKTISLKYP